jgi:hypothetical protein
MHQPFEILMPTGEDAGCLGDHVIGAQLKFRDLGDKTQDMRMQD